MDSSSPSSDGFDLFFVPDEEIFEMVGSFLPPPEKLVVDRALVPTSLAEEEKDFIKAASRDSFRYTRRPKNPVQQLLKSTPEKASQSDLGILQCLPLEILSAVIVDLDLTSYFRLRQVNKNARLAVTNVPKYRLVVQHAFCAKNAVTTATSSRRWFLYQFGKRRAAAVDPASRSSATSSAEAERRRS